VTRDPGRGRSVRGSRDPYGIWSGSASPAPILSALGLAVAAILTVRIFFGDVSFLPGQGNSPGASGDPGPVITPAPSNVVIPGPDPIAQIPGSFVYAKQGSIWIQAGRTVRQLTSTGADSMPSWSADGQWVYYIHNSEERGNFIAKGEDRRYIMSVPHVMRIPVGGGTPEEIASGATQIGRYNWFGWIRSPVVSPDGSTIAVVSDLPNPSKSDVVLQFINAANGKLRSAGAAEQPPLGHQDPAWRPDGTAVAYVKNGRDGTRGSPAIWRYDVKTKRVRAMTGPGYQAPDWSRDGRYLAATKTSSVATDVVILDAATGAELLRVTNDGSSWSPVWSPAGDAIAFLHIEQGIVDLRLVKLGGSAPTWQLGETLELTKVSGLDGSSRPDWFIPADQLPALPSPSPAAPAVPASPSPAPSL
jgi:dipeptidyl aminopeptidase/acylaminoacyl peptidase